jgi:hypothetical protein
MSMADSLLEFPCDFPLKIMGANVADFAQTIAEVVRIHAPEFDAATMDACFEGRQLSRADLHGACHLAGPARRVVSCADRTPDGARGL